MAKSAAIAEEFEAIKIALEVLEPLDEVQRNFAVTMILSRLGMAAKPQEGGAATGDVKGSVTTTGTGAIAQDVGVRTFLKQKNPITDLERYVCLAYYLTHHTKTPAFTSRDVTKLNLEGGGQDFSNPAATATNALRQSKLLSKAGGGKKRITLRGEALVEALPDRAKVKDVIKGPARKRSSRKQTKKKG